MKPSIRMLLAVMLSLGFVYAQNGYSVTTNTSKQLAVKSGTGDNDSQMRRVLDNQGADENPKKQNSPRGNEQRILEENHDDGKISENLHTRHDEEEESDGEHLKEEVAGSSGDGHASEQGQGGHYHKPHKSMFISPALLTTKPAFIITVAVLTAFIWCSGYVLDFLIERQEQLADSVAISRKRQDEDSFSIEEFDLDLLDRNADISL
ncbi:hypothetical protein BJV82DRAFT_670652 [Fennellomyces sp. T-0311]|nr:hypothetical protein BJV82DRAFT_670652 [Fennellomyces sp. T-0311]